MAASAIAKGLTQLLARNVGARITTSFKPFTFPSETINQPLKLRKFAEKQAEQYAETTEQGKRLNFLKTLRESCKDKVTKLNV